MPGVAAWALLLGALALLLVAPLASAVDAAIGEQIYRDGRLPSGAPLHGERAGLILRGAAAACVNCHQRSGLGSYEGSALIPPIIGPYLFRDRQSIVEDLHLPHVPGFTPHALPYDRHSLARALRTGVAPGGRTLSVLMPRYSLNDGELTALIGYLASLGSGAMPGVSDEVLEFATIVTPDADPEARAGMLEVMEKFFAARNALLTERVQGASQRGTGEYRAARRWHLQIWELTGPPGSWGGQLQDHMATSPVFALVAGLGRGDWTPIHKFCEQARLPCLMPETDAPPVVESGYYSIYYTRGVYLEADLILAQLAGGLAGSGASSGAGGRIVQVFRTADIGAAAAAYFAKAARARGFIVEDRAIDGTQPGADALAAALDGLGAADTLVLWLRPADAGMLGQGAAAGTIYISGLMAGLEKAPLPIAWRSRVLMTYPFDTPGQRRVRMNFPLAWFRGHEITLRDERVQSDTWLTCSNLADALDSMLDSYVPDFLIERLSMMLDGRHSSAYYPRLGLGAGQRFASKGGFIAKYDGGAAAQWLAASEWIVP